MTLHDEGKPKVVGPMPSRRPRPPPTSVPGPGWSPYVERPRSHRVIGGLLLGWPFVVAAIGLVWTAAERGVLGSLGIVAGVLTSIGVGLHLLCDPRRTP